MTLEEFEKASWRRGVKVKVTNLGVFPEPVVVKVSDVDFDYYDIGFWKDKKYHCLLYTSDAADEAGMV